MLKRLLPTTLAGRWATGLFLVFILLAIAGGVISSSQESTIEYPAPFTLLGTVIYSHFAAVILSSIAGIIAVKKYHERSPLVYMVIPLGIIYAIGLMILFIGVLKGPPNG